MNEETLEDRIRRRKEIGYRVFFGKNQPEDQLDLLQQQLSSDDCGVCRSFITGKKRQCGICKLNVCGQHLRKKRRHPKENTWKRVCDDCEDRHLFESYMKFELKTEQALQMHEEIIRIKNSELSTQYKAKQVKISVLRGRETDLLTHQEEARKKYGVTISELEGKLKQIEGEQQSQKKLWSESEQLQKTLPRPLEDDFEALKIEDDKITKELVKLQKRIQEAIQSLSKKEKELTKAYEDWEKQQTNPKKEQQEKCKVS